MIAFPQDIYLTPEQYLQMEEDSSIKHEYINGKIYAIAGTTDTHNAIALNIAILLRNRIAQSLTRFRMPSIYFRYES